MGNPIDACKISVSKFRTGGGIQAYNTIIRRKDVMSGTYTLNLILHAPGLPHRTSHLYFMADLVFTAEPADEVSQERACKCNTNSAVNTIRL